MLFLYNHMENVIHSMKKERESEREKNGEQLKSNFLRLKYVLKR